MVMWDIFYEILKRHFTDNLSRFNHFRNGIWGKPMTEPVEVDKEKIELLSIVLIEFTAISYFWAR